MDRVRLNRTFSREYHDNWVFCDPLALHTVFALPLTPAEGIEVFPRSLLTIAVLILLICLVSPLGAEENAPLRLATFQCDVTPPLGGQPIIWIMPLETIETPLLAKGIVLDDGQQRYVLCAIDYCGLCNSSYELVRSKLAEGVGTDVSHVAVQCVHQHTAPYMDGDAQKLLNEFDDIPLYVDFKFLDKMANRLATAAKESLGRLALFDHVGTGQAKVDRVASNRRIRDESGTLRNRYSGTKDPTLHALPEGTIDPMLKTITLARGQKPLVRLHYYATHPQSFYGDPRASYDVPGFARERLQEKEGVFQIYFTGCAGDVAMGKYNDRTPRARDELTERLYAGMEASAASTQLVRAQPLSWKTAQLTLPVRTDKGHTLADNRARMADPKEKMFTRVRAATRIAFTQRINRPIEISTLKIGNVRILNLPGECMILFQLHAYELRPDDFVAVAAYGDLGPGYICADHAFKEGLYEPSASRAGCGSEPALKAALGRLLEDR